MFGAKPPRLDSGAVARHAAELVAVVDRHRLRRWVEELPSPRSRIHWPEAMAEADRMIAEGFRAAGWDAVEQPFRLEDAPGFLDLGTLHGGQWGPTVYPRLDGVNVVATRSGRRRGKVCVIAHHDTVRDSPGADDNTASVAALLELARVLGPMETGCDVVLAAVDMEEIGLHGSRTLAALLEGEDLLVIVLETVAYTSTDPHSQLLPPGLGLVYRSQVKRMRSREMRGDFIALLYRKPSAALAALLGGALSGAGVETILLRDPVDLPLLGPVLARAAPFVRDFARSDHKPFWERGTPAVLLTDTANFRNPNYHQPTDASETLDYDQLARIVAGLGAVVAAGIPG